jgi:hypothetical protein
MSGVDVLPMQKPLFAWGRSSQWRTHVPSYEKVRRKAFTQESICFTTGKMASWNSILFCKQEAILSGSRLIGNVKMPWPS